MTQSGIQNILIHEKALKARDLQTKTQKYMQNKFYRPTLKKTIEGTKDIIHEENR